MFEFVEQGPARFGMDFRLNDLPRDAAGEVLFLSDSMEDYLGYVHWLADYLYAVRSEPGPRQRDFCDALGTHPKELALQLLAMEAASYDGSITDLILAIGDVLDGRDALTDADVETVVAIVNEDREAGDDPADEPADGLQVLASVDLRARVTAGDVRAVFEEMRDRERLAGGLGDDFLDMPWRFPLAAILQDVTDHDERVRLLRGFFTFYQEYDGK